MMLLYREFTVDVNEDCHNLQISKYANILKLLTG